MEERRYISVILPLRLPWLPLYGVDKRCDVCIGDRVNVKFAGRRYVGVVGKLDVPATMDADKVLDIESLSSLRRITEQEIKLWKFIADYYLCTLGEVYKAAYPASRVNAEDVMRREEERQSVKLEARRATMEGRIAKEEAWLRKKATELEAVKGGTSKERSMREMIARHEAQLDALRNGLEKLSSTNAALPSTKMEEIRLTAAQGKAMGEILTGMEAGKPVLLQGVTGSGKTEIYITLAKRELAKGRSVLYMVPEIALSRQLESRLGKAFGDTLLTFHSAETPARRQMVAARLSCGPAIVLGTRSALFLPYQRLGLVIVDEEHDTSYKQDSPAPRYQGRDTAVMMAKIHGCGIVLGSATPSLESLYNCDIGKYSLVRLEERFFGSPDADVLVIDTIAERKKNGMMGDFSRKLLVEMGDALSNGGQILMLRARRSYAPIVQCKDCGRIVKCPSCNVSLSYHKDKGRLYCHYCGYSEPFSGKCVDCGGELAALGAGTQKIEEEASHLFPDAKVARLDADTAAKSREIVESFSKGYIDILVGTQMIAKGFDFEKLSLVVVLNADSLLAQQDFRADEKTHQLLEQLMGRAGRRGGKSRLIIQTSRPGHPIYTVLQGESNTLTQRWMEERREYGYPPYTKIINVIVKDINDRRIDYLSSMLAKTLAMAIGTSPAMVPPKGGAAPSVIGPYHPAADRLNKEHIRNIRIVLRRDATLSANKKRLSDAVAAFECEKNWTGHVAMDVDPA